MSQGALVRSKRWTPISMAVVCVLGLVTAVGAQTSKLAFAMGGGGYVAGLYVMDPVPGSTPVFLTEGSNPDWSPDGREIVFSVDDVSVSAGWKHYVDIWIIGADGSNAREILRQERVDGPEYEDVFPLYREMAWSPDGSLIAVSGYATLYFVRPDGVLASRIGRWGRFPDWTLDGRHIVYVSRSEILILEADGIRGVFGRERVIHEGPASRVQVSPDGSRIAFASPRDPETGKSRYQVGVMDLDGSNVRFLAEGWYPCWSPDSRRSPSSSLMRRSGAVPSGLSTWTGATHVFSWSILVGSSTLPPGRPCCRQRRQRLPPAGAR